MDHTFIVSMETRLRVATLYINKYKAIQGKIIKAILILILVGQYEEKYHFFFFIFFIFLTWEFDIFAESKFGRVTALVARDDFKN